MDRARMETVRGTRFPTFAFKMAQAVDLDLAERRVTLESLLSFGTPLRRR